MGTLSLPTCPATSSPPPDYSKQLPRGVPPVERAPTSMFPYQKLGPADTTWYFPIDVGLRKFKVTGVFVPKNFTYSETVDIILYFHGNKLGEFSTINEYWQGNLHKILLREDLNGAGKGAVLVAPTLGENPGHGLSGNDDLGNFGKPGAAKAYLDEVVQWLGAYDPHYAIRPSGPGSNTVKPVCPKVGKIILAGHSGGGSPIHVQMESLKASLCEIWCFDVVYFEVTDWIKFAYYNPSIRLTFYHAVQSLDALNLLVQWKKDVEAGKTSIGPQRKLDNLEIFKGATEHFRCLTHNFQDQAKRSKCL